MIVSSVSPFSRLQMLEKFVIAWQQKDLSMADFGIKSKSDEHENLIAGRPERFQNDLLEGIDFLKERVENIGRKDDRISQVR